MLLATLIKAQTGLVDPRKTIGIFMHNSKNPDFMEGSYWLSKELGLRD
jgi:hypothetical protein